MTSRLRLEAGSSTVVPFRVSDSLVVEPEVPVGNHDENKVKAVGGLGVTKLAEGLSVQLGMKLFVLNPALYSTMIDACERGDQSLLETVIDATKFDVAEDDKLLPTAVEQRHPNIVYVLGREHVMPFLSRFAIGALIDSSSGNFC